MSGRRGFFCHLDAPDNDFFLFFKNRTRQHFNTNSCKDLLAASGNPLEGNIHSHLTKEIAWLWQYIMYKVFTITKFLQYCQYKFPLNLIIGFLYGEVLLLAFLCLFFSFLLVVDNILNNYRNLSNSSPHNENSLIRRLILF